jgi:hypothetical protein
MTQNKFKLLIASIIIACMETVSAQESPAVTLQKSVEHTLENAGRSEAQKYTLQQCLDFVVNNSYAACRANLDIYGKPFFKSRKRNRAYCRKSTSAVASTTMWRCRN